MIELKPISQADLDFVRENPLEGAVKQYPYIPAPSDNAFSVYCEGELVRVGGLVVYWDGVGELWLMLTSNCKREGFHGVAALLTIRRTVDELIEKNNLWRAQATVRTDFPQACRMVEALGFEKEGLLKQYCPDKADVYMYARLI